MTNWLKLHLIIFFRWFEAPKCKVMRSIFSWRLTIDGVGLKMSLISLVSKWVNEEEDDLPETGATVANIINSNDENVSRIWPKKTRDSTFNPESCKSQIFVFCHIPKMLKMKIELNFKRSKNTEKNPCAFPVWRPPQLRFKSWKEDLRQNLSSNLGLVVSMLAFCSHDPS